MDIPLKSGGFVVAVIAVALIILLWISIREYVGRRARLK
jgi:hypothetical protein